MEIIKELVRSQEPTATALGFFDGVHKGHQAVISECVGFARVHHLIPAVFTLQQSPRTVLLGEKPNAIITLEEKLNIFRSLGVERVYLIDFRSIRHISAEDFVKDILIGTFYAEHTGCGFNYHFGNGALGNGEMLSSLALKHGISETTHPRLCYGGLPISSTRIRKCISEGNVVSAKEMLGRTYGFFRPVEKGRQLGRKIGFPTINQTIPEELVVPKNGAYASVLTYNGERHMAVTNIGVKPTVSNENRITVETWAPDCELHIPYGDSADVRLYEYLRPERKYESLDMLKEAVMSDAALSGRILREKYGFG